MSAEQVARRFVDAINRHDVEAICSLMTEDHRFIDAGGQVVVGREQMRAGWIGYFKMVPDYAVAISETYARGDAVVVLGRAAGKSLGDACRLEGRREGRAPRVLAGLCRQRADACHHEQRASALKVSTRCRERIE